MEDCEVHERLFGALSLRDPIEEMPKSWNREVFFRGMPKLAKWQWPQAPKHGGLDLGFRVQDVGFRV